jgi:hypothetical protein
MCERIGSQWGERGGSWLKRGADAMVVLLSCGKRLCCVEWKVVSKEVKD